MAALSRLPIPVQESYEWQYLGACREVDPETFFSPESERGPRRYPAGTSGPTDATTLIERDGRTWHEGATP